MNDSDWQLLLEQIDAGTCTPFLGAGASWPHIETGTQVARAWAREKGFPLDDASNLGRVAQYMALNLDGELSDPSIPKRKMVKYLSERPHPTYGDPADLHTTLAQMPLPVYITTNYDSFIVDALTHEHRDVRREFCRWNKRLERRFPPDARHVPSVATPLVYHLHGHDQILDSLVLTEDDYIDFIVNVSQRPELVPPVVQDAMTDNMLMFLGYSLSDWNFRVLFRTMQNYLENSTRGGHLAVQLRPDQLPDPDRAARFFERYFKDQKISVFWGTCQEFNAKLRVESQRMGLGYGERTQSV